MTRIRLWPLIKSVFCRFQDDEVPALGAQMTYYLILSFFPFLIFLLTLTAYTPLNSTELINDLVDFMPDGLQKFVRDIFTELMGKSSGALLSFGMVAAVWTASSGMMAIIRTLNKAYEEEEHRSWLKVRLLSVLYTIGFTLTVWLAIVLLVFGQLLGQWMFATLRLPADFTAWWAPFKYGLSLALMCLIFICLFYTAPSRRMKVRETIAGAIFATAGWAATSFLFSLYVNHFGSYARTYGSLGGIIALLVWLYLSSILLLVGGELNAAIAFMRAGKSKENCRKYGFRLPFLRSTKN